MNHETKLKRFETAVFEEIETKTAMAESDSKEEFEEKLRESTDRQLQKSYEYIQNETAKIKKNTKRELAKLGLLNKRALINKRNELVESIFSAVEEKIVAFNKTQEYQDFLLDEVEAFAKKYELSDIEIHIGDIDVNKENYIKKAYKLPCSIVLDNNIKLGGFAIKDNVNYKYYDYTLQSKLCDSRDEFILNSEFAL